MAKSCCLLQWMNCILPEKIRNCETWILAELFSANSSKPVSKQNSDCGSSRTGKTPLSSMSSSPKKSRHGSETGPTGSSEPANEEPRVSKWKHARIIKSLGVLAKQKPNSDKNVKLVRIYLYNSSFSEKNPVTMQNFSASEPVESIVVWHLFTV